MVQLGPNPNKKIWQLFCSEDVWSHELQVLDSFVAFGLFPSVGLICPWNRDCFKSCHSLADHFDGMFWFLLCEHPPRFSWSVGSAKYQINWALSLSYRQWRTAKKTWEGLHDSFFNKTKLREEPLTKKTWSQNANCHGPQSTTHGKKRPKLSHTEVQVPFERAFGSKKKKKENSFPAFVLRALWQFGCQTLVWILNLMYLVEAFEKTKGRKGRKNRTTVIVKPTERVESAKWSNLLEKTSKQVPPKERERESRGKKDPGCLAWSSSNVDGATKIKKLSTSIFDETGIWIWNLGFGPGGIVDQASIGCTLKTDAILSE